VDGLRWLLLIFGALVVAGVYFYTRRERQNPPDESAESPRITPTLNDAGRAERPRPDSTEDCNVAGGGKEQGCVSRRRIDTRSARHRHALR